ncbi:TonB-dependent receptor [Sphingomonas sp.]|uniref:TonB-dependent receptor n=1 Tax=Sphingomonas sp. TaxID=28214 RepID=UPI00333EAA9E
MKMKLCTSVAFAALLIPGVAFAQSTGSVDFDKSGADIIVTASSTKGINGVQIPDTSKAKGQLDQAFISRQTPGQTILDTINQLPGVNFQNNDPFGSAGGTLNIRGFDASRISLSFDGIPLNDTGNYALYSNQQLDPELIENVNVSYGSTDVDSPTAAATGSTVNYRTSVPTKDFGVRLVGSVGDFSFFRVFGLINTGEFTSFGTKAWFSASKATNDWFVNDFGKIDKQQFNARIYQPLGSNGDFISVAGNYNENRNNFGGSAPLRSDTNIYTQSIAAPGSALNPTLLTGAARTAGTNSSFNRFPLSGSEIPYHIERCTIGAGTPGVADAPANIVAPGASNNGTACGTSFDERYNPSNTGSIRINSRFTLASGLVLTVDPSFQYVLANGGGTVTAREGFRDINPAGGTAATSGTPTSCANVPNSATNTCRLGYFAGNPFVGKDLNGDGDLLDTVNVLAPSTTQTRRYGVIANLRWDFAEGQTVRVGYTFDRGRHRQTGEINALQTNGFPTDVFPLNNPILAANGEILQKRDRLSYATLNQVSGEYRGLFLDKKLSVSIGIRAPFYRRDLNQYCFASSAGGSVECFGRNTTLQGEIAAANPYTVNAATGLTVAGSFAPPATRRYTYSRVLPNVGFTFKAADAVSVYGSYSKGLSVPGTDNLYNQFFYNRTTTQANPTPETTDNFDAGIRYNTRQLQIQVGPWYTRFTNRLASAFDPDTQQSIYRNLGRVDKYGIDGSLDFRPIPEILLHLFGSYLKSDIKNNIQIGNCTTNTTINCATVGDPIFAYTAGKRESGASVYSFGARAQGKLGPVELGVQAKRYGRRYLNDQNIATIGCTASLVNQICPTAANTAATFAGTRGFQYTAYNPYAPGYTLVDLDARLSMGWAGLNDKTYLQFNLQNVFNKFYVGGFSGGSTTNTSVPFAQIGTPRTVIVTLNAQF